MAEHSKLETAVEGIEAISNIGVLLALMNKGLGRATNNQVQLPLELTEKVGGIFSKEDEAKTTKVILGLKSTDEKKRQERIDRAFRFMKYLFIPPENENRSTFMKCVLWVERAVYSNDLYTQISRLEKNPGNGEQLLNMLLDKIEGHIAEGKSEEEAFQAVYLEYKGSTLIPLRRVDEDEGQGDSLAKRLGISKETLNTTMTWVTEKYNVTVNGVHNQAVHYRNKEKEMGPIEGFLFKLWKAISLF